MRNAQNDTSSSFLEQTVGGGAEGGGAVALGAGADKLRLQSGNPVVKLGDRQLVEVLAGEIGQQIGLTAGQISFIEHGQNR